MFKPILSTVLMGCLAFSALADNTVVNVKQVSEPVSITDNVDYAVSSSTPFTETGSIDIVNTENAIVILHGVKPSEASDWLAYIKIDGQPAVENENCQVRLHRNGTMILPYSEKQAPLVLYTDVDKGGSALPVSPSSNMISLAGGAYNNKVRSFTIRRGYMVCLNTRADGTGYSRIFIADKTNRTVNLPSILDQKVSAVRVLRWYDANKRGYAGNSSAANAALKTTWCYNWDAGNNSWKDREYVVQHHHEGWPSISSLASNGSSPNLLANNEPDNTADDREHPATVSEVLKHWPEMMATGKRLGSPAVAGDYNWLYQFIDSIDARGWRCDFVCVHAYWYSDWESWKSQLKTIHERTGRPIWITEMNYGANWTGWPGSNTNGNDANYAIHKQHFAPIIDGLEATDYIERYAAYNAVQDCRRVWLGDDKLTPSGKYYADKNSGLAFNSAYGFTPKQPDMHDPSNLVVTWNDADKTTLFSFYEPNGEYNRSMVIEKKVGDSWVEIDTPFQKEIPASYAITKSGLTFGDTYRIHIVTLNGVDRYSNVATCFRTIDNVGDVVMADGKEYYIGANIITNGEFDEGLKDWNNGTLKAAGQPGFQVVPFGGAEGDNDSYLQSWMHTGANGEGSLARNFTIEKGRKYYFGVMTKNNTGSYQKLSLSADGAEETKTVSNLTDCGSWQKQTAVFDAEDYTNLILRYRWLGSKSQYDKFYLAPLYNSREEALAAGENNYVANEQEVATDYSYLSVPTAYIQNPDLKAADGWSGAAGTVKDGDQRTATQLGLTCWNAWWSGHSASEAEASTLDLNQTVKAVESGYYRLQCKAATQHYCLSDQHSYISTATAKAVSPELTWHYLDIPDVRADQAFQTLTTDSLFIADGEEFTIGFTSSKNKATDYAWRKYATTDSKGDNREGWWCATDFKLLYLPAYKRTADAGKWQTICLPYDAKPANGIKAYAVTGRNEAATLVMLTPVADMEAGRPYIYINDDAESVFLESGAKLVQPLAPENGMGGFFKNTVKKGCYILVDGEWQVVTAASVSIGTNQAYIKDLMAIPVVVIPADAVTLPVAQDATGIGGVYTDGICDDGYTLGGVKGTNQRGVIVKNGKKQIKRK